MLPGSVRYTAFAGLLAAASAASIAMAGTPQCPLTISPLIEVYPASALTYPIPSDQYAVQFKLDGGGWTDAMVYITKYGGTMASPFHTYSGYPQDKTSMSFVNVTVSARTSVALRVTKLASPGFPGPSRVSVRPRARGVAVDSVSSTTVELSTRTPEDFAGEQFILWWDGGDPQNNGGIQGLAFFLNPAYEKPTTGRMKTISSPDDLKDVSSFDTLDFEGIVGGADPIVFDIPANIQTVFLGPGSWLRGKLRFEQTGLGQVRRLYGSGVVDASRFNYADRHCKDSLDPQLLKESYQALSFTNNPQPDQFHIDGITIGDPNYYATSSLKSATINNVKIIGWNGNNDGFQFGLGTQASNIFVRTGDDSLKMWDSSITVTNATVWQNFNGGVVNLGWTADVPGENGLIDGLNVVKMDWVLPAETSWIYDPSNPLDGQNNAVIASMMVPGTQFGRNRTSTYRNITVEDTPRVLFSLKILPPDTGLGGGGTVPYQPELDSTLNLNVENVFTPASVLDNSIGFQTREDQVTALHGGMKIGLRNIILTLPDGTITPLTQASAGFAGKIGINGDNVNVDYGDGEERPAPLRGWFSAWTAGQGGHFPGFSLPAGSSTVRMIVRPVVSGNAVRVKIENINSSDTVSFAAAYIGQVQSGSTLVDGTNRRLTFNHGSPGVTLEPFGGVYSDPLPFPVTAFTRYAVSLDVTAAPAIISGHTLGLVTNFKAAGWHAAESNAAFAVLPPPDPADPTYPFYWVAALDVASESTGGTVVALGDSITDGKCSTRDDLSGLQVPDLYQRWTDLLAIRFSQSHGEEQSKSIVNEGIAGNTVFGGGNGPPALVRLENDALFREGVTHVIFFDGTNDIADEITINHADPTTLTANLVTADQLAIDRAHEMGVKIVGVTILPRGAQRAWSAPMETVRAALNDWIRHKANFDGIIDFDAVMTDGATSAIPAIQTKWLCRDNDGVHPNADGYAKMASVIDLGLFRTGGDR
jgi:lysophospholipase L1-like esterase